MAEGKARYEGENIDFADYSSAESEGEFHGKFVGRFWGTRLDECIDLTKEIEAELAKMPDYECQAFAEDEFEQYLIKEKGKKQNEKEQQNKNA